MPDDRPMGLTDPLFQDPYVDLDEWRDEPVRHRYVHGGFHGSDCRFSVYFPEARALPGTVLPSGHARARHRSTRRPKGCHVGYIEFSVASGALPRGVQPRSVAARVAR